MAPCPDGVVLGKVSYSAPTRLITPECSGPAGRGSGRKLMLPTPAPAASASQRALGGEAGAAGVAVGGGVLLLDDEQRAVRERLLHRCQVAGWFRGLTGG